MRAPEITYRFLSPIDVASPTYELWTRVTSGALANVNVIAFTLGIAKERVLVLNNIACEGFPGAAQACTAIRVVGITQAGQEFSIIRERFAASANAGQNVNWQGDIWIAGRGTGENIIIARAEFDAGVAINNIAMDLQGAVIPRGNVATF